MLNVLEPKTAMVDRVDGVAVMYASEGEVTVRRGNCILVVPYEACEDLDDVTGSAGGLRITAYRGEEEVASIKVQTHSWSGRILPLGRYRFRRALRRAAKLLVA